MAAPVIESVSAVAETTTSSLQLNAPSGVVAGDLLVMTVMCAERREGNAVSGWDKIGYRQTATVNLGQTTYAREADGTSSDTPAVTFPGAPSQNAWGIIHRVSGHDGVFAYASAISGFDNSLAIPTTTADADDSLVLVVSSNILGSSASWSTGWTKIAPDVNVSGGYTTAASRTSAAGTTPGGTVTFSTSGRIVTSVAVISPAAAPPSDDRDVSGSLTLPAITLSGAVESTVPQHEATGELTLPALTLSSTATAEVPQYEASGALALPTLTLSGAAEVTVPEYDVSGTLTLPALQLSGDVDRTLPEGAVVGSLTLPSLVLSGLIEAEVPEFTASGTLTIGALTLSGTVVVGVVPEPPVDPGAVPWQYMWWIGQGGGVMESALTLCPGPVTMESIGPGLSSIEPVGPGSIEIERVC